MFTLALWHGFNTAFVMTLAAFAGGIVVYLLRHRILLVHAWLFPPVSGRNLTEAVLARLFRLAAKVNALIENGSLQRYLGALVASAVVAVAVGLWGTPIAGDVPSVELDFMTAVVSLVLIAGAVVTVLMHRQRVVAVVALGVVGLMVSLQFVHFSAPDLAMTQLLVEFTTVILILLALFFLPAHTPRAAGGVRRVRAAALAVVAGVGMATLTYAMLTRPQSSISSFFMAESKPGGGTNVVNVILVDFRGFDTLGEITVLGIAAVGVVVMLASARVQVPVRDEDGLAWSPDRHPVMLAAVARALLPFALLVSAYLFLRGHNLPGGGFIAALVAGVALILQYVSDGSELAQRRLGWNYVVFIGRGVLIATATGLGSWLFGHPFLTSSFTYLDVPLIGEIELATALLFDLGVFGAVVGTVMLMLASLGRLNAPPDTSPPLRSGTESAR